MSDKTAQTGSALSLSTHLTLAAAICLFATHIQIYMYMCMCESLYELRVMPVFDHSHKTIVICAIFERVDDRVKRKCT